MSLPVLEVRDLQAWYGESQVLHGIGFHAKYGEVIALLGREGAGRTSILRAILGLTGARSGSVRIQGAETIALPSYRIAQLGVGYCPEECGVFTSLSCEENLLLPPSAGTLGGGMSLAEIYAIFPELHHQRYCAGFRLNSGEQKMLALGRILRSGANLLLLDEISHEHDPAIVQGLARMVEVLKSRGYTVILAERHARFAAPLADRVYVVEQGQVFEQLDASELQSRQAPLNTLPDS